MARRDDWRRDILDARRARAEEFQEHRACRVQSSDLHDGRLRLMLMDASYTTEYLPDGMRRNNADRGKETVVRLYGRTASGARVTVNVTGFHPYFFCERPPHFRDAADARHFIADARQCVVRLRQDDVDRDEFTQLNRRYESQVRDSVVSEVEWYPRGYRTIMGARARDVLKVKVSEPRFVAPLRNALEHDTRRWTETVYGPTGEATARECEEPVRRVETAQGQEWPKLKTYESDMGYVMRFLIDKDMRGMGWFDVQIAPQDRGADWAQVFRHTTHDERRCGDGAGAMALYVDQSLVQAAEQQQQAACTRILSFDIECMSRSGDFPVPEPYVDAQGEMQGGDPVITICASGMRMGAEREARTRVVFQLGACDAVQDAQVYACATERELLRRWDGFVRAYDPDIVTGWNTDGFDFQYLVRRAQVLGLSLYMGRDTRENRLKNCRFSSSAYGTREWSTTSNEGRTNFDMLTFVRREYKLPSYELNAVAQEFLNRQKEDMPYSMIPTMQRGSSADRARLASYCLTDAELPLLLMLHTNAHHRATAMARVTGVPLSYILDRGQQIKIFSTVYREARRHHMLLPHETWEDRQDQRQQIQEQVLQAAAEADEHHRLEAALNATLNLEMYDGAAQEYSGRDAFQVLRQAPWRARPKRRAPERRRKADAMNGQRTVAEHFGATRPPEPSAAAAADPAAEHKRVPLYEGATVLPPKVGFYRRPVSTLDFASLYPSIMRAHNMCYSTEVYDDSPQVAAEQVTVCPTGDRFVKADVRKGILPLILDALIAARADAKRRMAAAGTPEEREIWNSTQLAYKVVCNSVYGATGATTGKLPRFSIARSVTAFGRQMIELTRDTILRHYTRANGHVADAQVIYGDTDSVMVLFGVESVGEAIRLGHEAVGVVNALFIKPISLEFEKVYLPYDLRAKKQYIGGYWTRAERPDRIDAKGIAQVRRDRCMLVKVLCTMLSQYIYMREDYGGAMRLAEEVLTDLARGRTDLSKLIITKSVSRPPEQYVNRQAHIELMKRMQARDPETAPRMGDRMPYVMVQGARGQKAYELAEDPTWVMRHGLPIDCGWYLTNQMERPLTAQLRPVVGEDAVRALFARVRRQLANRVPRPVPPVRIDPETRRVELAYEGEAPRKRTGILAYARRRRMCMACGAAPARTGDGGQQSATCAGCSNEEARVVEGARKRRRVAEHNVQAAWEICRDCQGANFGRVECGNRHCHHFYRRQHVLQDLVVAIEELPAHLR